MTHDDVCRCAQCRDQFKVDQLDRDVLAIVWAHWRPEDTGEVNKLRAGENGSVGSPRFIALQAIAKTRLMVTEMLVAVQPPKGAA